MNSSTRKRFVPVRTVEIGMAVVFGIVLAVFIIGFIPVSHPVITRKVMELARQTGADSCAIGRVSVAFWKGVTLRSVRFTGGSGRFSMKAESVTLRGNFFRAALGRTKSGRRPFNRTEPLTAFGDICRSAGAAISRVTVSGAQVAVADKAHTVFQGQDCSIDISFSADNGRNCAAGSFAAKSLVFADAPVLLRLSGECTGAGDVFSLTQCRGKVCEGKFQCTARVDLAHNALAAFSLSVHGFDFDEWYRNADAADGRLSGKADCRLALDSSAMAVDSLRGKGSVSAVRFEAMDFPFQKTLSGMLGYTRLMHLRFRKCSADCTVKPGGIIETDASGDGDSLCIKVSGWFRTDGFLNENAECTVTRAAVNTLPEFARKTLEETKDGGCVLRLRIFGMAGNPRFEIDSRVILQKAVKNMFDEVRDNLQKWLK